MKVQECFRRYRGVATVNTAIVSMAAALFLSGCATKITNASDLKAWVKKQAQKQYCTRESIELDDWYTETADGNVWYGNCRTDIDDPKRIAINVDRVWDPSKATD